MTRNPDQRRGTQRRRQPATTAALAELTEHLRQAEAALVGAGLPSESVEPAMEWIAWQMRWRQECRKGHICIPMMI